MDRFRPQFFWIRCDSTCSSFLTSALLARLAGAIYGAGQKCELLEATHTSSKLAEIQVDCVYGPVRLLPASKQASRLHPFPPQVPSLQTLPINVGEGRLGGIWRHERQVGNTGGNHGLKA